MKTEPRFPARWTKAQLVDEYEELLEQYRAERVLAEEEARHYGALYKTSQVNLLSLMEENERIRVQNLPPVPEKRSWWRW
jgi:hypothetical protein